MPRRIVLVGRNGFIAQNLCRAFGAMGDVRCEAYASSECNLLSGDSIRSAVAGVGPEDTLVVPAAVTRLTRNDSESMVANLRMMDNLAGWLIEHPVGHVVYFSTVDVYGVLRDDQVIHEGLLPKPDDYYAVSKLAGEYLLARVLSRRGVPLTVFRLTGIYGPGDRGKSTIARMTDSAIADGVVTVHGDGASLRDFVHVSDLVRLTRMAVDAPCDSVVNVATGHSLAVAGIARLVAGSVPEADVVFLPEAAPQAGRRTRHMRYDISRLRALFPRWAPADMESGVRSYVAERLRS